MSKIKIKTMGFIHSHEEILETALKEAESKKLFFIDDVVAYLPVSRTTFYTMFPNESDGLNTIKEVLKNNKISLKVSMRKKWFDSDNPTLQIGLMKIIGTEEEAHRLNGSSQRIDHTTKGEKVSQGIDLTKIPTEVLEALEKSQKGE